MATEGRKFYCQGMRCRKIVIIAVRGSQIRKDAVCYCDDCNTKMQAILRLLDKKKSESPLDDIFGPGGGFGDLFRNYTGKK